MDAEDFRIEDEIDLKSFIIEYNKDEKSINIAAYQIFTEYFYQVLNKSYLHSFIDTFLWSIFLLLISLLYSLKRENRRDVLELLSKELASSITTSLKSPEKREPYTHTAISAATFAVCPNGV